VFSPFYAWSGRRDPLDHCALNVCLYGPRGRRWALTERRRQDVEAGAASLTVGPSSVRLEDNVLVFDIAEHGAPIPYPVTGQVVVRPEVEQPDAFTLDEAGRHVWRPFWPRARVEARFTAPGLAWDGDGYVDMNAGVEPLEDAFRSWRWARTPVGDGAAIVYDCTWKTGEGRTHALQIDREGHAEEMKAPPPEAAMPGAVWGVDRPAWSDGAARLVETLEDTPFYTRSLIETELLGEPRISMHESLDLERFSSAWVKLLLPFRMRRAF